MKISRQYKKQLRPYISELRAFLLVAVLLVVFIFSNVIPDFHVSGLSVSFVVVFSLWLFMYVETFVVFSLLVIADCLSSGFVSGNFQVQQQYPFRASTFADKTATFDEMKAGVRVKHRLYFKIIAEQNGNQTVFTTTQHFDLEAGKTYQFVYGARSKAVVHIAEL